MTFTGANRLMGMKAGRFDGHAHVFRADLPMMPGRRYTPGHDAQLADLAVLLRAHALDGAILVQPSFLGTDNSFLLSTLATATDRLTFKGVVMLDPATSSAEIADLSEQGIIGMRLNLVGGAAQSFDISLWDGVLRRIDDAGWHVELHCEAAFLPPLLDALLACCRTVVIDHFGLPDATVPPARMFIGLPADRVIVKISAPYRVFPNLSSDAAAARCLPLVEKLAGALGPENLTWGSDWPWTRFEERHTYSDAVDWLGQFDDSLKLK